VGENLKCRGLSRPDATTSNDDCADAGAADEAATTVRSSASAASRAAILPKRGDLGTRTTTCRFSGAANYERFEPRQILRGIHPNRSPAQ
jgi:hypothetical protein